LIYPGDKGEFTLHHPESHPNPDQTTVRVYNRNPLTIEFSGKHEPHLLRVAAVEKPATVVLDGKALAEGEAWWYDAANRKITIRTHTYAQGKFEIYGSH
jgi:hypothetical protein